MYSAHYIRKCTVTNWFCVSARYEIRAASSEDCVFVPPNLYDVIARRSVSISGISTAGVWLGWLRYLLALVPPAAGAPLSSSSSRWLGFHWILGFGTLVVAASACLPTRCLGVACCALDPQRVRFCGLREASPFSD